MLLQACTSLLVLQLCQASYKESPLSNVIVDAQAGLHVGFALAPGVLKSYEHAEGYDYRQEYSSGMASIYHKYLKRPTHAKRECFASEAYASHGGAIDDGNFERGFLEAGNRIEEYESITQSYLASDPRGMNFSAFVYLNALHAKFNEFLTESIKDKKCLSRKAVTLTLSKKKIPPNPWKKTQYCETESPISLRAQCNPHELYRRLDGKCNNLHYTNLGSQFRCYRRLLPADYDDGISQVRMGVDHRPLPSPRLVTQVLMPDLDLNDPKLTAMHTQWGQLLVHDVFRTPQFLGLAIDCCRVVAGRPGTSQLQVLEVQKFVQNQPPMPHPECLPIVNFPPNKMTILFNQKCLNTVRSVPCNTCSLGPRNQVNGATQLLDLSNLYGGNMLNNSELLRTYMGGQMLVEIAHNGETTMPRANSPVDTDTVDLTPCNPPIINPGGVGCFRTGDGIRGNQNPFIASLQSILLRRHNMHAASLALLNPLWDDERLFQEARRLLIAEVTKIHYSEYLTSLLGKRLMKYFHLSLRDHSFTKYNPDVDPSSIQSAGTAALRMGHSQVRSVYKALPNILGPVRPTSFLLRDRFFNMIEVWQGRINPVLQTLLNDPAKNVDPYGVTDLKDHLFFNPRNPQVIDLLSININRGRDHGVPAYVYHVQMCHGFEIKSWKDLERLMPPSKVKGLRKVYRHYRDIDLFLGGLMEYHLKGAKVGPTFACIIGIQFYHWKYGDRFYFEHGGQVGSFKTEQLDEIRRKVSLANLICKTTSFDMIQMKPLEEVSQHNPRISCAGLPEIDYTLWREGYGMHG